MLFSIRKIPSFITFEKNLKRGNRCLWNSGSQKPLLWKYVKLRVSGIIGKTGKIGKIDYIGTTGPEFRFFNFLDQLLG